MSSDNAGWSIDFGQSKQGPAKSSAHNKGAGETRLGRNSRVVGRFEFSAGAELNGELEGEVYSAGELIIGETGKVRASIKGEVVKVFGEVEGDIVCRERFEAFAGAKITGDIVCPRVVMHDGVFFEGHCDIPEDPRKIEQLLGNTGS